MEEPVAKLTLPLTPWATAAALPIFTLPVGPDDRFLMERRAMHASLPKWHAGVDASDNDVPVAVKLAA